MASKNIEINIKTSTGDYETLYPSVNPEILKLNSGNVEISTDLSEKLGLQPGSSIEDILTKLGNSGVYSSTKTELVKNWYENWVQEEKTFSVSSNYSDFGLVNEKVYFDIPGHKEWVVWTGSVYHTTSGDNGITYYHDVIFVAYNVLTKRYIFHQLGHDFGTKYPYIGFAWGNGKIVLFGTYGWIANDTDFNFSPITSYDYSTIYPQGVFYKNKFIFLNGGEGVCSSDGLTWEKILYTENNGNLISWEGIKKILIYKDVLYLVQDRGQGTVSIYKTTEIGGVVTRIPGPSAFNSIGFPGILYSFSITNDTIFIMVSQGVDSNTQKNGRYICVGYNLGETWTYSAGLTQGTMENFIYYENYYYGSVRESNGSAYWRFIKFPYSTNMATVLTQKTYIVIENFDRGALWQINDSPLFYSANNSLRLSYSSKMITLGSYYAQNSYNKQSVLTDALSTILNLGDTYRGVYYGIYSGTGTYGSSNPNTLTFDRVPKFLAVAAKSGDSGSFSIVIGGAYTRRLYSGTTDIDIVVSQINNSVSWYNTQSSSAQMNATGTEYAYLAIC